MLSVFGMIELRDHGKWIITDPWKNTTFKSSSPPLVASIFLQHIRLQNYIYTKQNMSTKIVWKHFFQDEGFHVLVKDRGPTFVS